MSVLAFVQGEQFTFTVWSRVIAQPDIRWQNTFEWYANEGAGQSDLVTSAAACTALVIAGMLNVYEVFEQRISTFAPDSHPYDPEAFFVISDLVPGLRSFSSGERSSLELCLALSRDTLAGRLGKLYLRGWLLKSEVIGAGASWSLVDAGALQSIVDDGITAAGLDDMIGPTPDSPLSVRMISDTTAARRVDGFTVRGARNIKMNHKYFNRPTP